MGHLEGKTSMTPSAEDYVNPEGVQRPISPSP